MRLYQVEFKFTEGYGSPKNEGFVSISLVVVAGNQFDALTAAWQRLKVLELPEPASFSSSLVKGN